MQITLLLWLFFDGGEGGQEGVAAKAEVWRAFVRVEAQRLPCTWGEKLGAQIICVSPLDFLYN
jgi:hypothetical protein